MMSMLQRFKTLGLLSLLWLMPGCVLVPGHFYLAVDGGYQDVEIDKDAPDTVTENIDGFEADDVFYSGALGYGISLLKTLYVGAEVNFSALSFDDEIATTETDGMELTGTTKLEESLMVNAVVDGGIYVGDWLIFGRTGYAYVDTETSFSTDGDTGETVSDVLNAAKDAFDTDEASAFLIGGGLEYDIGLGLGVRAVYLYHEGDRNAHDARIGVVWRF